MCRPHSLRQHRSGFSLLELMLVIGIMVTLSAIAIPRYGRAASRYQADAAAKVVSADLQLAQRRARAASKQCVVTFFVGNGRYNVAFPTVNGVTGRVVQTDLAGPPYRSRITGAAFGNSAVVTFDGYGVPIVGGSITIVSGNEQRVISVAEKTGAIAIQ